jgi:hypothetical protein
MIIKKYNLLVLIFLLLFWLSFWFSINTKPDEIDFSLNHDIISIINTLRISVPLLLSIIAIPFIFFFLFKKKKNFEVKLIINPLFLFLIYFVLQSIGLYFNTYLNFSDLNNSYLLILGIGSLQVIFLLNILNLNKNLNLFLYASFFFIAVSTLVLMFFTLKNKQPYDLLYLYYYIDVDQKLFEQTFPRITGLARMMAVINLALLASFFFIIKKKIFITVEFFFIIILSMLIWSFQSRGAILCFTACTLVLIFFYKEYNFKKKIIIIFFIIIFPVFIFETYKFYKMNMFVKMQNNKEHLEDVNKLNNKEHLEDVNKLNKNRILRSAEQGSSGRIYLWKYTIEKYDKKKIFGYGPQADRFLISKKLNEQFGNNVSNGFLYAFASGGYFALVILILIYLKNLLSVYRLIFLEKIFQIKYYFAEKLATIYLLFFSIRILFENSYALFSVDFLITLICLAISSKYLHKKNYCKSKV